MARKRLIEAPPPVASSSEDEEEDETQGEDNDAVDEHQRNDDVEQDSSEEEEDGDEEEEEDDGKVSPVPKPTVAETPSKSDSGSEPDSDSDMPSPSASAFTIKPIVSNPKKSAPKRPAEPDPAPDESPAAKRKKNKASEEEEEAKKGPGSQRLWSEDDEIAILSGMTRFQAERGADPYTDMGAFHDFLKKSLHVDVSKNQLMDKIRRLKKKYQNNIGKSEDGQDPVFSKPHDVKSFELSKKVWGNGGNVEKVKRSGGPGGGLTLALASQGQQLATTPAPSARRQKKASNRAAESGEVDVKSEEAAIANRRKKASNGAIEGGEYGVKSKEVGATEEWLSELLGVKGLAGETRVFLRNNVGLVEKGKLKELEAEWERLKKGEVELFLKRLDLEGRMVKLVMDAVNSQ